MFARCARPLAAVVAACALLAAAPSAGAASRRVTVCAHRATMYETPGGAVVGVVRGGDRVAVLRRSASDDWWRVGASFGTRGWIRAATVCPENR